MLQIPPLPELPSQEQSPAWTEGLLGVIAGPQEQNHLLREQVQTLRQRRWLAALDGFLAFATAYRAVIFATLGEIPEIFA
jgi:hypothetical protein